MKPVVPAIIPTDATMLRESLKKLIFSNEVHVDVVDGNFVPFVSWPFNPAGHPGEVKSATDAFTLEVDLMVTEPLKAAQAWVEAGADMLVVHVETCPVEDFKYLAETQPSSVSVCISANNDTPYEDLAKYIPYADGVQVMGIAQIGSQGQPLDERVFARVENIKHDFPGLPVTVDGSVNVKTILRLHQAGVDRFICGSAIIGSASPQKAYEELKSLLN